MRPAITLRLRRVCEAPNERSSTMPNITKHDHVQLIARARAALETPADLDADAVGHLIEDLAAAETRLATHDVPWSLDIHIGHIDHKYGNNFYAALSREALMVEIAEFCRDNWNECSSKRAPDTVTDEEAASVYFNRHPDDYLSTERISMAGPDAAAPPRCEIELTLILSSAHIRPATADLLMLWSEETSGHRPLGTSGTDYGWIVRTTMVEGELSTEIPADLAAALALGRRHGCRHVLFDHDATPLDTLETFDW